MSCANWSSKQEIVIREKRIYALTGREESSCLLLLVVYSSLITFFTERRVRLQRSAPALYLYDFPAYSITAAELIDSTLLLVEQLILAKAQTTSSYPDSDPSENDLLSNRPAILWSLL